MSMRTYTPYATYKDSGVEWLGAIPAGWEVKRADAFLSNVKRQVEPSTLSAELVFHYSIPSIQATGDGQLEAPSTIDSSKLAITGQLLLVSKLNPRKGVVLIATEKEVPTVASTEFVPFEAKGCDIRWALYLSLAESTRQRLSATVRSATRSHQRAEVADITKVWHAVPSLPEQRAIATFLDRETARIDELVAKKERLITLLQERRTALITRAVTKGLDPAAPMKHSGVEWLGEIPAHWEVRRLKECVERLDSGGTPESDNAAYWTDDPSGIPWVAISDMTRSFHVTETAKLLTEQGLRSKRLPLLPSGTLLYSMYASLGKVALLDIAAVVNQAILGIVADESLASRDFLRWWLEFMQGHVEMLSSSSTQDNLSAERVRAMPVILPSLEEQSAITANLEAETARIASLVSRIQAAITRLYELRTALISAAVTGKIDVREAAQ